MLDDRRPLLFVVGAGVMFSTVSNIFINDFFLYAFALGFFLGVPPVLSWISQLIDHIEEGEHIIQE